MRGRKVPAEHRRRRVQYQDSENGERSNCAQINQEEHELEVATDLRGVRWARTCMLLSMPTQRTSCMGWSSKVTDTRMWH